MVDYKLVDLQLRKEEIIPGAVSYYLSAVYTYENDRGVYEVTIPKIELMLRDPIIKHNCGRSFRDFYYDPRTPSIDIGMGDMRMLHDENNNYLYEKCIKEKIHDMTLAEIEKKLGYKVRVVSEKE